MEKWLSIIYAYYDNPKMFLEQQLHWSNYPDAFLEGIEFIIVDDCSPKHPALYHDMTFLTKRVSLKIFRVTVDIPWNQDHARNLGVSQSKSKWLFLSDMDHVLPVGSVIEIFKMINQDKLDPMRFYNFDRVDAPNHTPYKHHPNTWLLSRKLWDKVGGYDESAAGHYGTDGPFKKALYHHSKGLTRLNLNIIRYPREVIPDASTTTLDRKKGRDRERGQWFRRLCQRNLESGIPPKTLTFPWRQVL